MMLNTIKQYIKETKDDNITFEEWFTSYVMYVQDENIGDEINFVLRHNVLDPKVINNMVEMTIGGIQFDK